MDIFGYNTVEYQRYNHISFLDTENISFTSTIPIERIRAAFKRGFEDDLQDAESNKPSKMLNTYLGLALHTEISETSNMQPSAYRLIVTSYFSEMPISYNSVNNKPIPRIINNIHLLKISRP